MAFVAHPHLLGDLLDLPPSKVHSRGGLPTLENSLNDVDSKGCSEGFELCRVGLSRQ
jgi:hypothetical protein